MKKRVFGQGYWNGSGGKFDHKQDKNIYDTAEREVKEELGIGITEYHKVGELNFRFLNKPK